MFEPAAVVHPSDGSTAPPFGGKDELDNHLSPAPRRPFVRILGKIAVGTAVAGGMLLATPAATAAPTITMPDIDVNVGSLLNMHANSTIDIGVLGNQIISTADPVDGLFGG
jgi:hypothetical protein